MFILEDVVTYEEMSGVITFIGVNYITIDISHNRKDTMNAAGVNLLIYLNDYKKVITSRQSEK